MTSFRADLKVVVADSNMKAAFSGLLTRHQSLGIRPLKLDPQSPLSHPRHDPGCWKDGPELLAIEHQHYRHGLLALDWEGCNSKKSADDTRRELQVRLDRLTAPGWGSIVLLQPELEIWVFAGSTEVDRALGWQRGTLTPWLEQQGHAPAPLLIRLPPAEPVRRLQPLHRSSLCGFEDHPAAVVPAGGVVMTMTSSRWLVLQLDRGELIVDRGELGPDRGGFEAGSRGAGSGSRGATCTAKRNACRQAWHGGQVP